MNNFLKETALACTRPLKKQVWDEENGCYYSDTVYEVDLELFSKAIAEECVNILMRPSHAMSDPSGLSEYNQGWVNGRLLAIEHIQEQFNIK